MPCMQIDTNIFVTQHKQMRQMSANSILRYEGKYEARWKFSKLQYFCQMIFGECSFKMHTQFILIAQENSVLRTFFYIFAIDLFKKSIIQLVLTQYIEFGIRLSWLLPTSASFTQVGSHFAKHHYLFSVYSGGPKGLESVRSWASLGASP